MFVYFAECGWGQKECDLMVKLVDIAKECGVSVAQVSRALGDYTDVSQKTRLRVRQTAEKMGYVPNQTARKLVKGTYNEIHFLKVYVEQDIEVTKGMEEDGDNFHTDNTQGGGITGIIAGINRYCSEHDLEHVIHYCDGDKTDFLAFCRDRNIQGAVLHGVEHEGQAFQRISVADDIAVVSIDNQFQVIGNHNKALVTVDNRRYAKQAVTEFLKIGRRRIVVLSGTGRSNVEKERVAGYRDALKAYGIPVDEQLILKGEFHYGKSFAHIQSMLEKKVPFDAVFAINDVMGMAAINALKAHGLQVPEDVAVCGFDGIAIGRFSVPSLSTVAQNFYQMGYEAAQVLHQMLQKEQYETNTYVPCRWISRDSTKPSN